MKKATKVASTAKKTTAPVKAATKKTAPANTAPKKTTKKEELEITNITASKDLFNAIAAQTGSTQKAAGEFYDGFKNAIKEVSLKTDQDELRCIANARIVDMFLLKGILSKYVLRGMTKAVLWSEGVENGVLLAVLYKLRELMEFYEGPLDK